MQPLTHVRLEAAGLEIEKQGDRYVIASDPDLEADLGLDEVIAQADARMVRLREVINTAGGFLARFSEEYSANQKNEYLDTINECKAELAFFEGFKAWARDWLSRRG